jgi:8-oxo-dGTP pyrophosphatase MutT (NUDIX family)
LGLEISLVHVMNQLTSNHLVERVRRLFGGEPCRLQVAALPWRKTKDGIKVMLVTSRDTGRWVLPKGWPEFGEQFCEAAAREAGEEAGLKGAISTHEAGRYYYSKGLADGSVTRCEVLVYALEVDDVADKWKEKGQRRRKWVTPAKAAEMVAEADLAKVILAFAGKPRSAAA